MAQFNLVFKRAEKKYLLAEDTYHKLMDKMSEHMIMDSYGLSTICNVYYDTADFELIRRSVEKPCYKEKFRVRSYGVPGEEDSVFLEIKKKYKGIVYKRRVSMSCKEAEEYLSGEKRPEPSSQIQREIDYFFQYHKPEPKVYIAYDRVAYYGREDEALRLTIDKNIRYREDNLSLSFGDGGTVILPDDSYLMELKLPGAMPIWMVKILEELDIKPCSFSKYGTVYRKILLEREENKCFKVYYKLPQTQDSVSPALQPAQARR